MFVRIPLPLLLLVLLLLLLTASADNSFTFNGFRGANLSLDGTATIMPEGLLRVSNGTKMLKGHAFYPKPIRFRRSPAGNVVSFSTTFVFGIQYNHQSNQVSGHGLVFVISPSTDFSGATGSQFLGLFNASNNGNPANRIVGVELDTVLNPEFQDINTNHVGIDVNGLISFNISTAGYYDDGTGAFQNLTLNSGDPMQVWMDYDGEAMQMNVTLAPFKTSKPIKPLLSSTVNLSSIFYNHMQVGFSSSTDPFLSTHYVLGWSFKIAGKAELDLSALPSLPQSRHKKRALLIWIPIVVTVMLLIVAGGVVFAVLRRIKFSEVLEDWEQEYGPNRFSYKVLFDSTDGFRAKNLLGSGGFGSVYHGVLPKSNAEVAVKRISHESRQGIKEFVAEVVSIGRVRHRNLVQLLGYCRRKRELLLVYEFMPNRSLDNLLFDQTGPTPVNWRQRFHIIKGVASGLQYLHEEWEQVVVHRDIKASNVLLDSEFNGRLGDFGLARLYDHGSDPQTTHVVGTMGYLAPELTRTGKATTATDVFSFGAFLLEVASGRRPIEPRSTEEELVLVDYVLEAWKRRSLLDAADTKLEGDFVVDEIELVLKLGLLCSHPLPTARPNMKHVMRFLNGDIPLPELLPNYLDIAALQLLQFESFDQYIVSYPSSFTTESLVSVGR